jgi:hypothetical protein
LLRPGKSRRANFIFFLFALLVHSLLHNFFKFIWLKPCFYAAKNPVTIDTNPSTVPLFGGSHGFSPFSSGLTTIENFNSTTSPVSIYSVVLGGDPSAIDYYSKISEQTGGKVYTSYNIVDSLFEVLKDIKKDIFEPDPKPQPQPQPQPQSVPEPTSGLGLLVLSIGCVFQKLKKR